MIKFIFNNKNSYDDMDCIVVGTVSYPTVKEKIDNITVPRRKAGSLTKKTGEYDDLKLSLNLKLVKMNDFNNRRINIQSWLEDIIDNKLYFLDNPTKCYIVKNVKFIEITPKGGYQATFKVDFICEPFLKKTTESFFTVSRGGTVVNDGFIECEPIIRLTLPSTSQTVQLTINGNVAIILKNAKGTITIDSSLMQIVGNTELESIGDFPILAKGNNVMNWTGTVNKLEIYKRTLWRG